MTAQNLNLSRLQTITSSFNNVGLAVGWDATTDSTGFSQNNTLFSGGGSLASFTNGPSTAADFVSLNVDVGTGPVSFTALYLIRPNGFAGEANLGINISSVASVPGPILGAGLPGLLLGLLGFGGWAWWRRNAPTPA